MTFFKKKVTVRYCISIFFVLLILSLAIYNIIGKIRMLTSSAEAPIVSNPNGTDKMEVSCWVAYWNAEQALEELPMLGDKINSVQAFAAIFDKDDKIVFPSQYTNALPEIRSTCNKYNTKLYLTIVNDRVNANETITQKDSEMLRRIMLSKEKRSNHIAEIVSYAKQGEYNGVEIDYEGISSDIWEDFYIFTKELYLQLKVENIELRIILEPGLELDQIELLEGPEYVMMAYNLYGSHSGPGPKADIAFIKKITLKMDSVPGKKWMAFSTGGFDWSEGANARSLTESEAILLAKDKNARVNRDRASGAVYFSYTDEVGAKHSVWFADDQTLKLWFDTSRECGYGNIAIWKLGGNENQTLKYIRNMQL